MCMFSFYKQVSPLYNVVRTRFWGYPTSYTFHLSPPTNRKRSDFGSWLRESAQSLLKKTEIWLSRTTIWRSEWDKSQNEVQDNHTYRFCQGTITTEAPLCSRVLVINLMSVFININKRCQRLSGPSTRVAQGIAQMSWTWRTSCCSTLHQRKNRGARTSPPAPRR